MIVESSFYYEIQYVPHKARKERRAFVRASAPIEVAEVSPEDAPVALRIAAESFSRRRNEGEGDDYRVWNGAFWRPATTEEYDGETRTRSHREITAAGLVASAAEGSGRLGHRGQSWQMRDSVPLESLMPCRLKGDPETLAEVEIRAIRDAASRLLVVGGVVHERVPEPIYRVVPSVSIYEDRWFLEVADVGDAKADSDPDQFFRADRFDDAFADWERRTDASADEDKYDRKDCRRRWALIEVLMPETLKFSYDMRSRVLSEARGILKDLKDELAERDLAFAAAYISLRDLVGQVPADHEAIARAAGVDLVAAMRACGLDGDAVERAERLLRDWVNRDDPALVRDADMAALSNAM